MAQTVGLDAEIERLGDTLETLVKGQPLMTMGWCRDVHVELDFKDNILINVRSTYYWRRIRSTGDSGEAPPLLGAALLPAKVRAQIRDWLRIRPALRLILDYKDGMLVKALRPQMDEPIVW